MRNKRVSGVLQTPCAEEKEKESASTNITERKREESAGLTLRIQRTVVESR